MRNFCVLLVFLVVRCAAPLPTPAPLPHTTHDAVTQQQIDDAKRVVFLIPFSHWDTDWHDTFEAYSRASDQNILDAIGYAKQSSRFRYTLEQVLFVQHFWETHPEARDDLSKYVKNGQFTFAWGGITQPETSLADPAIQERNLALGRAWITETFGAEFVPHTAWQSDAFGNSAALPLWLKQHEIPFLFIGRPQGRCDTTVETCETLPHAFYWRSPASDARVLVTFFSYPNAWDATHRLTEDAAQLAAFRDVFTKEFARTTGKYLFIPLGSDFQLSLPNLDSLVQQWNTQDQETALVVSDAETAFRYLDTQNLPEITVDMNPIWQAFYVSRPEAKIADKESAFYLTAAETLGITSAAWYTASINTHYDNIGAVSFDSVWESSQRPRFEQTVDTAAHDLANALAARVRTLNALVVVFNPSAWNRSNVVEVNATGALPNTIAQTLDAQTTALYVSDAPAQDLRTSFSSTVPEHPAAISQNEYKVTLSNGLVSVTLDAAHGGAFSSLKRLQGTELIAGYGDDIVYWEDDGDVYGARFGNERARSSATEADIKILAQGPLLARVQATFSVASVPVTKTVTLRANASEMDVDVQARAIPQTMVLVQTPTTLQTDMRTDDLGIIPYTHPIDARPIISGDITYRRKIFYPIAYWTDVSSGGEGITLLTHGLQGIAGAQTLSWMLTRDVTDKDGEGVTDREVHTLRYAYWLHDENATNDDMGRAAAEFNQPLIVAQGAGAQITVALPFRSQPILVEK